MQKKLLWSGGVLAMLALVLMRALAQQPVTATVSNYPTVLAQQSGPWFTRVFQSLADAPLRVTVVASPTIEPCNTATRPNIPVSTSSNVQLIAGQAGRNIRLCPGGILVVTTAGSFSLVEGTGSVCATAILGVVGSTTAANGVPLAATSGFLVQGGRTAIPGNSLCILLTGTGLISGNIEFVYTP